MSSSKTRLIDQENGIRTRPMQVLVMGMPRSGTLSMRAALIELGYHPHHMAEVAPFNSDKFKIAEAVHKINLWDEALDCCFLGKSTPYGRDEFDKLLGDYDAVTDAPGALFVDQLAQAYPEAKVILTARPFDKWYNSINSTIWKNILRNPYNNVTKHLDPSFMRPFYRLVFKMFTVHNGNSYDYDVCRNCYEAHCDRVRKSVPKERFLEFATPYEWAPLCEFLGQPVPDGEYPRINDKEAAEEIQRMWRNVGIRNSLSNVAMVLVPVVAAGAVLSMYFRRT